MIKAVIFDFDGVIIDSEYYRKMDLNIILKDYNLSIKDADFKHIVGKKTGAALSDLFPNLSLNDIDDICKKRRELQDLNFKNIKLIVGLKELVQYLKSQNYILAITTGSYKKFVENILIQNELIDFFDVIVSGSDFNSSKPNPECYEKTLRSLCIDSKQVIVIEDSTVGIRAAKGVNCRVIGIKTYLDETDLNEADYVFNSHKEILNHFKNLS